MARAVYERLWFRPLLGEFAGRDRAMAAFGFAEAGRTREGIDELTRGLGRSSRLMRQLLPLLLDWLSATPDPDLGLLGPAPVGRADGAGPSSSSTPSASRRRWPAGCARCWAPAASSATTSSATPTWSACSATTTGCDPGPARSWRRRSTRPCRGGAARRAARRAQPPHRPGGPPHRRRRRARGALDPGGRRGPHRPGDRGRRGRAARRRRRRGRTSAGRRRPGPVRRRRAVLPVGPRRRLRLRSRRPGPRRAVRRRRAAVPRRGPGSHLRRRPRPAARGSRRPAGAERSTPGRAYVERWAEPWERLAWVKARPVAGDAALGTALVDEVLGPWVWDRPLTDEERTELRRVKVRVERERIRHRRRPGLPPEAGSRRPHRHRVLRAAAPARARRAGDRYRRRPPGPARRRRRRRRRALDPEPTPTASSRPSATACSWSPTSPATPCRHGTEHLAHLAASLGTTPSALRDRHRQVTRRARRVVEQRFYGQTAN